MKFKIDKIAEMLGGFVEGDGSLEVNHFAPIDEADSGALSFISNPKYQHFLYSTKATAVLVGEDLVAESENHPVLIRLKDVYSSLSILLDHFGKQEAPKKGIEQPSFISSSAKMEADIYIGAFSYIGENTVIGNNVQVYPQVFIGDGVEIGENTIIYPGVKIYKGCKIGKNCIIHSGAVIGSDGFGFAPQQDGSYKKIPQHGIVILHNNVEIGANTTIDRATLKATIISEGVKLDNLIQVAHNVEIGAHTAIAAQTGISGSSKIGAKSIIGGQAGIVGHIQVAEGSQIAAQSGVAKTIEEKNQKWLGSPAVHFREGVKSGILFKKLPELYKRIQELEKRLDQK